MSVITITKDNFKTEVLDSGKPVLVDFWASWCGPCRVFAPIIEDVAKDLADVKVAKANIDDCGDIASSYGIMSVPTLVLFKGGKPSANLVGVQQKSAIIEMLNK